MPVVDKFQVDARTIQSYTEEYVLQLLVLNAALSTVPSNTLTRPSAWSVNLLSVALKVLNMS